MNEPQNGSLSLEDVVRRFADSERRFGQWFELVTPRGAKPCVVQCSDFPMTFARDGNLYYADKREGRGRIVRRTPEGRETVFVRDPALESIDGITCSPDGSPRRGPVVAENPVKPSEAIRPAERIPVEFPGTVHHLPVEGGVYVIRTADGTQYRPNELPEEYRVEGLAVDVKGLRHDDVLTKDMAGQAIDLVEIRRR